MTSTTSLSSIKSSGPSRIYRRETLDSLKATTDRSLIYSRAAARRIFGNSPEVEIVEYVADGNKLSSQLVGRGDELAPAGTYVIIASTGGKWGKSRRDYQPMRG